MSVINAITRQLSRAVIGRNGWRARVAKVPSFRPMRTSHSGPISTMEMPEKSSDNLNDLISDDLNGLISDNVQDLNSENVQESKKKKEIHPTPADGLSLQDVQAILSIDGFDPNLAENNLESTTRAMNWMASKGFPLVLEMSGKQWQRVLSLTQRDLQTKYLMSMWTNEEEQKWPKIWQEEEFIQNGGIVFDEETFSSLTLNEEDEKDLPKVLKALNEVYAQFKLAKRILPVEVHKRRHLRDLFKAAKESNDEIEKYFHYLGCIRRQLVTATMGKLIRRHNHNKRKEKKAHKE